MGFCLFSFAITWVLIGVEFVFVEVVVDLILVFCWRLRVCCLDDLEFACCVC